jgi:molybdenum cofactor cytidylyltransferase
MAAWNESHFSLVIPSYQMRRGHPWLVSRSLWNELLELKPPETLRSFLNRHLEDIHYVEVDNAGILLDLDTPGDYEKHKPC